MNRQIRRLGAGLIACYVALFAMLSYWQVLEAQSLQDHPSNLRGIIRDFNQPRGTIETADGVLLARSVPSGDDRFPLQREYLEPGRYAHLTGYFSLELGAAGIEQEYNTELAGRTFEQQFARFSDLFVDHDTTGDVILSVHDSVQQVAQQQLGDRRGSIVALDPRSGEILALWSFPSYDPNVLSSHDFSAARDAKVALDAAPGAPLLAHSYQERYFPGSTFKIVTAGAGLESGRVTVDDPVYPVTSSYTPPQTSVPIGNFGGASCGGTLIPILEVSCNTAFAEMAAETLGPDIMIDGAERFGFNDAPPIDLPAPARSVFPTDFDQNLPALAQAGIGQNDVAATPLQMALVAAAVANGGEIMAPTVMEEIRDADGRVFESADERVWRRALDEDDAATLRSAMVSVVEQGTAARMAIPGMVVGGKTGTAEIGRGVTETHAWVIGFAGPPGEVPRVAVAVLVEAQPGQGQQAGGQVAAPIARAVLDAALAALADDPGDPQDTPAVPEATVPPTPPPTNGPETTVATVPPTAPPTVPPSTLAPTAPPTAPPTPAPTSPPTAPPTAPPTEAPTVPPTPPLTEAPTVPP